MIGYFSIYKNDNEKYSGGILFLNNKGLPTSFKYTTPIQPGKIQKIIFGNNLKSYLASEVIGKQLIKEENDLEFIFVDDSEILDFIETDKLLICIKESFQNKETFHKDKEAVIALNNKGFKLTFSKDPGKDLFNQIVSISELFDLYEPFERLKEALKYVCSSEEE